MARPFHRSVALALSLSLLSAATVSAEVVPPFSDIDGHPLDFTTGTRLSQNRGIVATAAPLHDAVLEAIRAVCG